MGFKAILSIKHFIAIGAMNGGFHTDGKVRTGFISKTAGRAILALAVVMLGVLCIIASVTMAAIIGSVHEGRNTC